MMEVTAAVIWQGDKFLICQRPRGKYCGLLWEFPGGKIEPGETAEECIVRECREELGVTLRVHGEFYDTVQEHLDRVVHLHFFRAEIASGELTPLEHNAVAWVTQAETAGYEFCPADAKMLRENELGESRKQSRAVCSANGTTTGDGWNMGGVAWHLISKRNTGNSISPRQRRRS